MYENKNFEVHIINWEQCCVHFKVLVIRDQIVDDMLQFNLLTV